MTERIGPYRVYERLGVGGMGEVFKAYDDRLDRWVAIKRIRPDRLDAEDNRERFKREARATARLNHPAIVHLYGIFQDEEDADCIVMEFVDGRTLDTFLTEGPLEPLRVASLGHEIASGLAEAHANGILHRDLKAENIMITPRGRAKILDFGLAKPILASELDPVLTSKGQLVGTSRAMSPEYVSGEEVDHRSDLFSLGVLLYECLTGQSPFKAHNTLATLKQVMLHKQAPVSQYAPEVPQELSDLIDRLLAKDPTNRPQNAEEVALAFGRLTGQISSGIIDTPNFGSGGHQRTSSTTVTASDTMLDLRSRRRWVPVVAILVVLLIGAFFLGRMVVDGPGDLEIELPPEKRIEIVLGEFANNTGEDMLGESLAEAFRAFLEQSRSNTLISRSQILDALSRMQKPENTRISREVGIEICQREGAERLILGNISRFGRSYSIVIDVVEPSGDRNTLSVNGIAKGQDELLATVENLAREVRSHLGESAQEITDNAVALEKVTTSSLEALKAYTLGERHLVRGRSEDAIEFFRRAVSLDESFAMANVKLGVTYINLGDSARAVDYFNRALEQDEGLNEFQKHYLKGWLARWRGDSEQVIADFGVMAELYPSNRTAHFNLGLALWAYHNDFEGAVSSFERALEVSRGSERSAVMAYLGLGLLGLDRHEAAMGMLQESQDEYRLPGLVALALIRRDTQEARSLVASIVSPAASLAQSALIDAFDGQFESAEGALVQAEELALSENDLHGLYHALADQAALAYIGGDRPKLTQVIRRTLSLRPEVSADNVSAADSLVPTYLFLAKMANRLEQKELVNELLGILGKEQESVQVWRSFRLSLEAELVVATGQKIETALEKAQLAVSLASSVQQLETLALVNIQMGDYDAAMSVWEAITRRAGLAFVECTDSCRGRLYSSLVPQVASFFSSADFSRSGALGAEQSALDPEQEALSLVNEMWSSMTTAR